jgi:hypothetical protein
MMFNLLKFQIKDRRGNLSVVEGDAILLMLKECIIYMMYRGSKRGGHCHMEQQAF